MGLAVRTGVTAIQQGETMKSEMENNSERSRKKKVSEAQFHDLQA